MLKQLLAKGESFPFDFQLTDIDDKPVKLADFKGKVLIVDFWGNAPGSRQPQHIVSPNGARGAFWCPDGERAPSLEEKWRFPAKGSKGRIGVVHATPIVAGGTLEQVVAAFPFYRAGTGRGFVMALEPASGRIMWKYDVGPQPQPLNPPITIKDSWGDHVFHFGPATSSVWSTPSFDAESGTIFFGTDVNAAPRRPTDDDPRLDTIAIERADTKVVGVGCKNGGFYVLRAFDGAIVDHTPICTGPPGYPLSPEPDRRMLALPSAIGGLQTGCATDGRTIFTNGIDALRLASQERREDSGVPPTAGRVVALSLDTRTEFWRHERPKVASLGGPPPKPAYADVGDPVASGIAVANGVLYFTTVASGKLVALDSATGEVLKEIDLGPVWSGPSVSRGRVYAGTGNTLFNPLDFEAFFPKKYTGEVYCFGLPETLPDQPLPLPRPREDDRNSNRHRGLRKTVKVV